MRPNPFKPTAGATPPYLVGRDSVLDNFGRSIDDGPGSPGLLTRLTGPRGTGKTALLTAMRRLALDRRWVAISETATVGLVARLTEAAAFEFSALPRRSRSRRLVESITLPQVLGTGGGGIKFAPTPQLTVDLRLQMNLLIDALGSERGVLITVDEIHKSARDDLRILATVFQHWVTEDRPVGLVMAGLPVAVSDLLNDKILTFLRRAMAVGLADVDLALVRVWFEDAARESGLDFSGDALDRATAATLGYPYMIQLVGYHIWHQTVGSVIDSDTASRGIEAARSHLSESVLSITLADLSDGDRAYLAAMAQDDGPSVTGAVAKRLGKSAGYAGQYRLRLLDAGVIRTIGHGRVTFALPYLREYIRAEAAR